MGGNKWGERFLWGQGHAKIHGTEGDPNTPPRVALGKKRKVSGPEEKSCFNVTKGGGLRSSVMVGSHKNLLRTKQLHEGKEVLKRGREPIYYSCLIEQEENDAATHNGQGTGRQTCRKWL